MPPISDSTAPALAGTEAQPESMKRLGQSSWLAEVWEYRELLFFFIWRDVKIKYKQSVLGISWAILQPVFTVAVFTLFFGRLAKLPSDGAPYPIFFYSAVLPWTYLATGIAGASSSLIANANLITKVYFPRYVLPASSVLSGLVDFFVATTVLLVMMWHYEMAFSPKLVLWPFLVLVLSMLAIGVGMWLAALSVRYRDVKYVLPFFIQAWMFISPVIYPVSLVPERYRFLLFLNPAGGVLDAFRASVLSERSVDWPGLWLSTALTLAVFALGAWYFRKTERDFADVI